MRMAKRNIIVKQKHYAMQIVKQKRGNGACLFNFFMAIALSLGGWFGFDAGLLGEWIDALLCCGGCLLLGLALKMQGSLVNGLMPCFVAGAVFFFKFSIPASSKMQLLLTSENIVSQIQTSSKFFQ